MRLLGRPAALRDAVRPEAVARGPSRPRPRVGLSFRAKLRRDRMMLVLMVPGVIWFVIFHYIPLLGNVVAFEDYRPFLGLTAFIDSPWVGLDNFARMVDDPQVWNAVVNTLELNFLQLVFHFPAPIALALLLNSVMSASVRRFVQSIVYLPHFMSWVLLIAIYQEMFGGAGVVNHVLLGTGHPAFHIVDNPVIFKPMIVLQGIWKDIGWGTIIFMAALLNIDPNLYEAAAVDGAGRLRRLWHITLPGLMGVTVILLILRLGQLLTVGFEQILLQRDFVGAQAAEVLDTFVYYHGIQGGDWGLAAAVGMVKALLGLVLILGANQLAHALGSDGIYRRAT